MFFNKKEEWTKIISQKKPKIKTKQHELKIQFAKILLSDVWNCKTSQYKGQELKPEAGGNRTLTDFWIVRGTFLYSWID